MSLIQVLEAGRSLAERIPYSLVALVARFGVASVFWRSGQTKVEGFHIREATFSCSATNTRFLCCRPTLPPICRPSPSTSSRFS